MAINVSNWRWGYDNQAAYDPTTNRWFMGAVERPAQAAPKTLFGTDDIGNPIYSAFGEDAPAESHPWTAQGYFPVGGYQYTTTPIQNAAYERSKNEQLARTGTVMFGAPYWTPDSYSGSDFTNIPEQYKSLFSDPNLRVTSWDGSLGAPTLQQINSAPEESFLSSFMQGPGMVLGSALGANAIFGGGLGGLSSLFSGGGASLFPGEAVIGNAFNPYGGSFLGSLANGSHCVVRGQHKLWVAHGLVAGFNPGLNLG